MNFVGPTKDWVDFFFFLNIPKWIIIVRDLKIKLSVVPVIIGVLKYIIIKYNTFIGHAT